MEATVGRKARTKILVGIIATLALVGGMAMAQSG